MRSFAFVTSVLLLASCKKEEAPPPAAPTPPPQVKPVEAPTPPAPRSIDLKVTAEGFQPGSITLKKDEPVKFVVTRVSDETCATELLIADTDIKAELPLNKPVEIAFTPKKAGQVKFGCAMDMMVSGMLIVE